MPPVDLAQSRLLVWSAKVYGNHSGVTTDALLRLPSAQRLASSAIVYCLAIVNGLQEQAQC